jgi:nitroreductase
MWRTYQDRLVDPDVLNRILDVGRRAPSAGFSQGFAFLVLEGAEQTGRFWDVDAPEESGWPPDGLRPAPVLIVPLASKQAYIDRYAEEDKGWTDRDESRWPVPYWYIDAAFASMLMLLAAVDEGLGALFFGLFPPTVAMFMEAFGIPPEWEPIGVIAMGHKAEDPVPSSRDTRPRKPFDDVVHRGHW